MAVAAPVVVEPMRLADVPAVHEIERLSFATPWPAYAFEQELTSNRLARYIVARAASRSGSRVVGFAGLWLMVDEAHITTFGVHPDWRRQGVGRQMLRDPLRPGLGAACRAADARGPRLEHGRPDAVRRARLRRSRDAGPPTTPTTARTPW